MMPKLNAAFWKWFGNSIVRDDDGSPMVVYHGTQEEFQEFQLYDACDVPVAFFTDDKSAAYTYGEVVMPVYLKIENPLVINAKGRSYKTFVPAHYLPEAVERGHDGLVVKNIRDDASMGGKPSTTYVIFDNAQVKAVDNDETWDRGDLNIYSNPALEDRGPEFFDFMVTVFDVQKAKQILMKKPREPVALKMDNVKAWLSFIRTAVDPVKAMGDDIDPTMPVIGAAVKFGQENGVLPIDGWHRIYKAHKLGLESVPMFLLTDRESKTVRIR